MAGHPPVNVPYLYLGMIEYSEEYKLYKNISTKITKYQMSDRTR